MSKKIRQHVKVAPHFGRLSTTTVAQNMAQIIHLVLNNRLLRIRDIIKHVLGTLRTNLYV